MTPYLINYSKIIFITCIFFTGCVRDNAVTNFQFAYYDKKISELKVFSSENKDTTTVYFDRNGTLKSIIHSKSNGFHEDLSFHDNGNLKSKVGYYNSLKKGAALYFYRSGYLKGQYEYENNELFNYGMEFWDTTTIQKTIFHFHDTLGRYYRRKDFDQFGNEISVRNVHK